MGVVGETFQSDVKVDGYPIEGTVYYIYCDNCGSFAIRTHIKGIHWLIPICAAIAITIGWNILINLLGFLGNERFGCWVLSILAIVILGSLVPYLSHKCINCGNTNITYDDVLGYSQKDLSAIIDVPKGSLHKHQEAKKDLFGDMKKMPLFVFILLGISLLPLIMLVALPLSYIYSKFKKDN